MNEWSKDIISAEGTYWVSDGESINLIEVVKSKTGLRLCYIMMGSKNEYALDMPFWTYYRKIEAPKSPKPKEVLIFGRTMPLLMDQLEEYTKKNYYAKWETFEHPKLPSEYFTVNLYLKEN